VEHSKRTAAAPVGLAALVGLVAGVFIGQKSTSWSYVLAVALLAAYTSFLILYYARPRGMNWLRLSPLWVSVGLLLAASLIYSYRAVNPPEVPLYIVLWGFIGSAAYVGKTVVGYIGTDKFEDRYIPFHVMRLIVGPAIAVILYFILVSRSFFGITLEVQPGYEAYAYAVVAFIGGYFVRHAIDIISNVLDSVFRLEKAGEFEELPEISKKVFEAPGKTPTILRGMRSEI
jgi:hypothetical protein